MVQNAIVKKVVKAGVVQVSLMRQMECGLHCDGACEGCGQRPTQEILALASDPIGSKAGDIVEVEPASGHNIVASVVVFLLPCVGLGAGYVVGQALFHLEEVAALATAALGLALGFVPAVLANRAIMRSKAPEFSVLKRLG